MSQPPQKPASLPEKLLLAGAIAWAMQRYPPAPVHPDPLHSAAWSIGALVLGITALQLGVSLIRGLNRIYREANWLFSDNTKGSARWMTETRARQNRLHRRRPGARFIGTLGATAIWLWTETHHLIIGPAGAKKTSAAIINFLLGNDESMLISDIKGELWETTKAYRETVLGHRCLKVDPRDPEHSACFNPLDPISRTLEADSPAAITWAEGMADQLHPDPKGGSGQNEFFYMGTRGVLAVTFLAVCALLPPERRTMDVAYKMVFEPELMHDLLDTACQSPVLNGELATRARSLYSFAFGDSGTEKTYEQYRMGAVQALAPFGPGNYLAPITQTSSFSFKDLKSEALSVYLTIDFANTKVLGKFAGLLQWIAARELVEVGTNAPVIFLLDECCNALIYELPKIMTLLRSYGVKLVLATQDHDDFTRVYGKHALETVLSETEIKQYLGGIRSKTTLEYLSKMLGDYTETAASAALDGKAGGPSISRAARRLATEDEIRQMPGEAQIVLYANQPPMLLKKVQVFAIAPWRTQIAPNSMYGGQRRLDPVEIRIRRKGAKVTWRGARAARRVLRAVQGKTPSPWTRLRRLLGGRFLPLPGVLLALTLAGWIAANGLPNLLVFTDRSSARDAPGGTASCFYLGPTRFGWQPSAGHCPQILWDKPW